jgi:uncharacterized OB-fold protein
MPTEKAVAHHWRKFRERYGLIGSMCKSCNHYFYPSSILCPKCRRGGKIVEHKFSGRGKVFSYTTIRVAPEGFEHYTPYVVAIVELEEGAKVVSQVVDCKPEDMRIGMPVETVFRKMREEGKSGLVLYGFKFRPVK